MGGVAAAQTYSHKRDIARRFKEAMTFLADNGVTDTQIRKAIDVERSSIHRWMNDGNISTTSLAKFCNFTGFRYPWMISGVGPKIKELGKHVVIPEQPSQKFQYNSAVGTDDERIALSKRITECLDHIVNTKHLSYNGIAEGMNCSASSPGRWGRTGCISPKFLARFCNVYGFDSGWLMTGQGTMLSGKTAKTVTPLTLPGESETTRVRAITAPIQQQAHIPDVVITDNVSANDARITLMRYVMHLPDANIGLSIAILTEISLLEDSDKHMVLRMIKGLSVK